MKLCSCVRRTVTEVLRDVSCSSTGRVVLVQVERHISGFSWVRFLLSMPPALFVKKVERISEIHRPTLSMFHPGHGFSEARYRRGRHPLGRTPQILLEFRATFCLARRRGTSFLAGKRIWLNRIVVFFGVDHRRLIAGDLMQIVFGNEFEAKRLSRMN